MNLPRFTTLIAVAALALSGCNREATIDSGNPLLVHVPADTPYLYANIEATPAEVIDSFILRAQPALDAVQTLFEDSQFELNIEGDEAREARLIGAVLQEIDGKLNRAGIESLGLSLESHVALYGMGPFPVIRISLSSAQALRDAVGRIEATAQAKFTEQTLGGTAYWKLADRSGQMGVYFAILDDHLAVGMIPGMYESEWLPALLGHSLPENSTAAADLAALNRDQGFSAYGSGFLNLQRMADELLSNTSVTSGLLQSHGQSVDAHLSEVCKSEIRGLVNKMPRLIAGTTELTSNKIGISYGLELDPELAGRLTELVADVPVADSGTGKALTVALGLKAGRLKNLLVEQATAIVENPYQCDKFAALNLQAQAALAKLKQPVPFPFINNLKGFRASIDELDFENIDPKHVKGFFSLEVEKPQMLIGTAQMLVPGLEGLDLSSGSDPVEVPQELLSLAADGMQVFMAMDGNSIGVSLGDSGQQPLAEFMKIDEDNGGVFFSMEYDMATQMQFEDRLGANLPEIESDTPEAQKYMKFRERVRESYRAWMGRTRIEMSFREDGIRLDTLMTLD